MSQVFIGVSSNLEPAINIPAALLLLKEKAEITGISTFYLTLPIGGKPQPPYFNGIVKTITTIPPLKLKLFLQDIEETLKRIRTGNRYEPRTIDLDILLYDSLVINEPPLIIPDPDITIRPFLAVPLGELLPDDFIPGLSITFKASAKNFSSVELKPLQAFTKQLITQFLE